MAIPVGNGERATVTVTIPLNGSLSNGVDIGAKNLARIHMPSSWTAASLTFQASADGIAWNDVYDAYGNEYTVSAAASRAITLNLADWLGVRWLKVRSGTTGSAVNQAAARDLTLVLLP